MKVLSSLDPKDRRMLVTIFGLVVALLILFAVLTPPEDPNVNPIPDSYLAGRHGAKAAFTLLQRSSYQIQRWNQPLSELVQQSGPGTTVILAAPGIVDRQDRAALLSILNRGGRVLATNFRGGELLPGNHVDNSSQVSFAACEAESEGLQPLAGSGSIWIVPSSTWQIKDPKIRVAYACNNQPVVVEYPIGKGTAIWWASSTPLENASITRGHNLELLLNSIGPPQGNHIYWDESLHGPRPSQWSYVRGPVWPLLSLGGASLGVLVIVSFSRRSGPVRPLPQTPRTTPIEFLDALGGLYRATGAATTVTQIAWERFRTQSARLAGLAGPGILREKGAGQLDARGLAGAIERRFGQVGREMAADLVAAEEACWDESLKPRRALILVQALRRHEETLRAASSHSSVRSPDTLGVTLGT